MNNTEICIIPGEIYESLMFLLGRFSIKIQNLFAVTAFIYMEPVSPHYQSLSHCNTSDWISIFVMRLVSEAYLLKHTFRFASLVSTDFLFYLNSKLVMKGSPWNKWYKCHCVIRFSQCNSCYCISLLYQTGAYLLCAAFQMSHYLVQPWR